MSCILECLMLERIGMKGQVTYSRFGSGTAGATGTGPTISRTEFRMNDLFAMPIIRLNPVATSFAFGTCDAVGLPINVELGQIKRLCLPSLPIPIFWHWPQERNPLLQLRSHQRFCTQISRVNNMFVGKQSFRLQRRMNGFESRSIVAGCCDGFHVGDQVRHVLMRLVSVRCTLWPAHNISRFVLKRASASYGE